MYCRSSVHLVTVFRANLKHIPHHWLYPTSTNHKHVSWIKNRLSWKVNRGRNPNTKIISSWHVSDQEGGMENQHTVMICHIYIYIHTYIHSFISCTQTTSLILLYIVRVIWKCETWSQTIGISYFSTIPGRVRLLVGAMDGIQSQQTHRSASKVQNFLQHRLVLCQHRLQTPWRLESGAGGASIRNKPIIDRLQLVQHH